MGKRLLMVVIGLCFAGSITAEQVDLGNNIEGVNVLVEQSSGDRTVVRFDVGEFNREVIEIAGENYNLINVTKEGTRALEGEPALPRFCRSIIIPDDAQMEINVLKSEYVEFHNMPVAPSKGVIPRTILPESVPYTLGDVYATHEFYPGPIAQIRTPHILRDYRGTVIELNAFQYNPGTKTLRVYTSVTVEVVKIGPGVVNVLENSSRAEITTPDFELIYQRRFLNYQQAGEKYTQVSEFGDILVITYDAFAGDMQPYVDWKMQKGIKTTMVNISAIGNNATTMKNYIQDFYDSTNLAFVLLVGDAAQVTTLTSQGGGADPMFALVAGGDSYPDIFIGRFSAENNTHVQTMVERTLTYEMNPPNSAWFHQALGLASTEGPGQNGEYDNEHIDLIRDDLLAYTYTYVDQFYGSVSSSAVSASLNDGRSFINYCGHGSTTAWSTSGFNNANVNALVNDNMPPFITSVACVNGQFRNYTCFAEAWTRASHNGVPTGAIGTYMSSINQGWVPPMWAEDEIVDLLCAEELSSYGALSYNGSCYMIDMVGQSGINEFETWHIFGDPSVQVRTNTPAAMTVNHAGAVFFNMSEYEVEVVGVEGALCALYANGTLFGSAYTDAGGLVNVPIGEMLPIGVPILLTVTAYNKATVIDTVMAATDLTILHDPLGDTKDTLNPYEATCTVYSDTAVVADQLLLMYQVNSVWASDTLELARMGDDYVGYIPAQAAGTDIDYYLCAGNAAGDVDTTETFSFKVIDYGLLLGPDYTQSTAPVYDTIWFGLTVTNDGVLEDDYALSYSGNNWDVSLWDAGGTAEISNTASLVGDATFDFQVRVLIPASYEDEYDSVVVTATSNADGSYAASASVKAISAGQPWEIPFTETFPGTSFDMTKWETTAGANVSTDGIDEPSAPFSADLDGSPSGADTLMTEQINLRNENNVVVKYYYQRTGGGDSPEPGDNLSVEYLDSLGVWHLIDQQPGDGADMSEFEEVELALPPDAYHSGFRLMIHNVATSGNYDDWFVDDIYVGYPPDFEMTLTPGFQTQYGPAGDTAAYLLGVVNKGRLDDQYDLARSSGVWDVAFYDEAGITQITSSGIVTAGDTVNIMVKVAIPESADVHTEDSSTITVQSQNEGSVSGSAMLATVSGGLPLVFPWYESFVASDLSTDWFINYGAVVSQNGLAPPSAPYSINLDGGSDTVCTRMIDLSGSSGAILSYYFQCGGGEPPQTGDDLSIDYKNEFGEWVTFQVHPGGGAVMTQFEYVNIPLPSEAVHAGFQLRMRSTGTSSGNDDWYMDDIRIDYAPAISVFPPSITEYVAQGVETSREIVIDNAGPGGLNYSLNAVQLLGRSSVFDQLYQAGMVEPARRVYSEEFFDFVDEKGVDNPNIGHPVLRNAGGPDTYGYYWIDSDEPGGPAFAWQDISTTGEDLIGGLVDDNFIGPIDLGFSFPYYENSYSQIYISSNGMVGFASTDMNSRFKTSIPTSGTPNNMICWLWDDLNPTDGDNLDDHVYFDTTGGQCVIQFTNYPEYGAAVGAVITTQVILSADGTIKLQYLSIGAGFDIASGTIGIENATGTDGLEIAFATEYLHDSLAVVIAKPTQWLSLDSQSGNLAPGASDTILCQITAVELDSGSYAATITVSSNDPDPGDNPFVIPVDLNVGAGGPPWVCGDIDDSGAGPDIADLVFLVDFMFSGGPPPPTLQAGDVDGSGGDPDIADLVYIVDYMFNDGPPPHCGQ
ncbi:MAG: C25 family cysteine peptidase [candidate division Zixibacteria bacterium]|nr:C25 family cysteine peptidase [candidate division Zixibacteria bacterium]